MPAHRRKPDPPVLTAPDWVGNAAADRLAGEAADRAAPPKDMVRRLRARRRMAKSISRVIAAVQAAAVGRMRNLAQEGKAEWGLRYKRQVAVRWPPCPTVAPAGKGWEEQEGTEPRKGAMPSLSRWTRGKRPFTALGAEEVSTGCTGESWPTAGVWEEGVPGPPASCRTTW